MNDATVHTLIHVMSMLDDTTIIKRSGLEGLHKVKLDASKAIDLGGMLSTRGRYYISELNEQYCKLGISPGGAADITAGTIMVYLLQKAWSEVILLPVSDQCRIG